jgi:ElaB/YqjD/DUF883 family membrane-anchored ribosome-binding protein
MKEATVCVADTRRRLDNALQELQGLVDSDGELLAETGSAELEEAKALLAANPISEQ